MTTVSLTNAGLIPLEAVTTMGVSAKEGDNPIGFFGTGLKYAISSLLRMGHRITIWRGLERFDFRSERGEVRGKEFDFVVMAGPEGDLRLGFTTHLGAKWEMWQAFRELYSNSLDECGSLAFAKVEPREGWTTIHVTGETFAEAARQRSQYFLSSPPIYSGTLVDIHAGRSSGIYYRGVLVARLPRGSALTYNITSTIDLTEDRTLKHEYVAGSYIAHTLAACIDATVIRGAVGNSEGYEAHLSFSEPGEVFAETVLAMCEASGIASVAGTAVKAAELWAQRQARVKPCALSPREQHEVEDAKRFLASIGYPITAPITFTETLGADVFGMAKDGRIYIARVTLARGGNFLVGTLLEEQLHISHGFKDESRRFQDFLIDMVVKFAKDAAYVAPGPAWPEEPPPAPVIEPAPRALAMADDDIPF